MQKRTETNIWLRRVVLMGYAMTLAGCLNSNGGGTVNSSSGATVPSPSPSINALSPSSIVSTIAGDPTRHTTVDGQGNAAGFVYAEGIAIDVIGNLYVADSVGSVIRKITPTGNVTTIAGDGAIFQGQIDAAGTAARFAYPMGIAVDSSGNIFVSDDVTIRKITPTGVVTTFAGAYQQRGSNDGQGTAARFGSSNSPAHLTIDKQDNLYIADGACIRKITSSALVSTIAGQCGTQGNIDGNTLSARFNQLHGITIDTAGNLYASEIILKTIRKISSQGIVTTIAGAAGQSGSTDGLGASAQFTLPEGLAVDALGNLLVADSTADTIRMITPAGQVSTIAGAASPVFTPGTPNMTNKGNAGSVDGPGSNARFYFPISVVFDNNGNLYVVDRNNHTIRKISA